MRISTVSPQQNDDTKKTGSVTFYFRVICSSVSLNELTVYLASSKTETDDEGNITNDHADITATLKCTYYDKDGTSCTYTTTETVNEPGNYSFSLSGLKASALNGYSKTLITFTISASYLYTYTDTLSSVLCEQGMLTVEGTSYTYPYTILEYSYANDWAQSEVINDGYPYITGFYESDNGVSAAIWQIDETGVINDGYPYIWWVEADDSYHLYVCQNGKLIPIIPYGYKMLLGGYKNNLLMSK